MTGDPSFQIGNIRVEPARNMLFANNDRGGHDKGYSLEPRVMAVLQKLAEAAPDVVTRDALLEHVWPTSYGADESLTRAVSVLRRAFREIGNGEAADVIETIPKRGYRLTQPPRPVEQRNSTGAPGTAEDSRPGEAAASHRRNRLLMFTAVTAMLLGSGAVLLMRTAPHGAIVDPERHKLEEVGTGPQLETSIAVLPFAALSDDQEDRVFADGLAAQLLATLARIADLRVANRRSSFAYRGDKLTAEDIGAALQVAYLLDGTVQRAGDRLRVTASLIRAADGSNLWVESYDRHRDDLVAVQDVIVRKVSRQLAIELGVGEFKYRTSGDGVPAAALEQYYLGLGYFGDRMLENDARSKAYNAFRYVTELAPEFAEAWAGMALVGSTSLASPLARNRDALVQEVEQAFTRALALNSKLREAQYAIISYLTLIGDVAAARELHKRQIARDPDDLNRQLSRATFFAEVGDTEEAFGFFDACEAEQCPQEGFIAFASFYAVLSGDPERIAQWRPDWDAFENTLAMLPPSAKPQVAKILPGLFSILVDRGDKAERVKTLRAIYAEDPVTEYAGLWAPVLANHLAEDDFFNALELAVRRGDFFGPPHSLMPFYGTNPYPDWVLSHPRYRAIFERPEMARFAELRQANGWTQGLPMPAAN